MTLSYAGQNAEAVFSETTFTNDRQKARVSVLKKDKDTQNPLDGGIFGLYAGSDITNADGTVIVTKGTLIEKAVTGEDGTAVFTADLPIGFSYSVKEEQAPEGYLRNMDDVYSFKFSYTSDSEAVVSFTHTFANERVNAKIDTLLCEATTGEDGKAVFALDMPFGEYYIRELAAPAGYVSSDEVLAVTAAYQGQDVKVVRLSPVFQNEPTKVSVKKTDITTGVELGGATLAVLDKDGNVVDTWTSVKGEEHIIERLTVGETYTLREELAPYGYLQAEEITFTVEDTAEIQKVEMKDDVPTGTLLINKKGEFLDKVSLLDSVRGWITRLLSM